MKSVNTNRILMYTLLAMTAIATYITINSYYTQLAIYEEKELFKLDCIANAVAYKISGEEYQSLIERFPSSSDAGSVASDPTYQKIYQQLSGAVQMTKVPSEIHTVYKDTNTNKFKLAIVSDDKKWQSELSGPTPLDSLYAKGGMIGRFTTSEGVPSIGAISLINDSNMQPVGVLQVNETFDSFIQKSKNQIYFNIILSLIFIFIIGVLMFFSVKNILKRQNKLASERQELELMRSELLANVSHDIRTPLSSIYGYVETMLIKKDTLSKEEHEKYLNTTLQSTEKLKTMVDELFELSKLENNEQKLNLEVFDISEIIQDAIAGFKMDAAKKGISINTILPDSKPKVLADLALMDRVLNNLLSNAIKHCDNGGEVSLSVEIKNDRIMLSIADNGSGISPEDLPHIFNRFHKGKTTKPGTGLGLAIVKRILEMHDSQCAVSSEPGVKTIFSFQLKKG